MFFSWSENSGVYVNKYCFSLLLLFSAVANAGIAIPNYSDFQVRSKLSEVSDPKGIDSYLSFEELYPYASEGMHPFQYLKDNKEIVLGELNNHDVVTKAFSVENGSTVKYLTDLFVGKDKTVIFQQDYQNYKIVRASNGERYKVGILFRIEATIVTKEKNVDLNGLFAIGLAVRSGSATGSLKMSIYGVSGAPVSSSIPAPSAITESSLQQVMQSIANVRSKLFDEEIYVIPQVLPAGDVWETSP